MWSIGHVASDWIEHDPPSRGRIVAGWLAAVGWLGVLVGLAWLMARAWRDDLPDPLAIHWGASGVADGTATLGGTVTVTTGLGAVGVLVLLVVGAALLGRPRLLRGWMTGLAAVAAIAPTSLLLTLLPNLGVESWEDATISGWHMALVVVLPAAVAAAVWFSAARPARLSAVGPAIDQGAPVSLSHEAFVERQVLRGLPWVAAATLALFAGLAVVAGATMLGFGLVLAGVILWLSVYRYRVTDEGLSVGFGPAGPLRRWVPVSEIEGARVVDMRPGEWGGWGYRTTGNDWAVILRKGPGCRVALAGKRSLSLTSDEAGALAGRVNAAVVRHWGQP